MPSPVTTEYIHLSAGQRLQCYLPRGSALLLEAGQLCCLPPPSWLADSAFRPAHALQAGQHWRVEDAGWFTLESCTGARLRCLPQPPHGKRPLLFWRLLQHFVIRRMPA